MNVAPFKLLYDTWKQKRVPSPEIMQDTLLEGEAMSLEHRKECVELFMENAKFLGLLRTINGAQRLITIEHLIDEIDRIANGRSDVTSGATAFKKGADKRDWKKICFFIAPIGEADSEPRKHSDMIQLLIERALERSHQSLHFRLEHQLHRSSGSELQTDLGQKRPPRVLIYAATSCANDTSLPV